MKLSVLFVDFAVRMQLPENTRDDNQTAKQLIGECFHVCARKRGEFPSSVTEHPVY